MRLLVTLLAVALLGVSSSAAAQTLTFEPLGGRTGNTSSADQYLVFEPINATECASGGSVTLHLTGLPAEPTGTSWVLSLWTSSMTTATTTCAGAADRRLSTSTMTTAPCVDTTFGSVDQSATMQDVVVPISTLFPSCSSTGTFRFCVVAMMNATDTTSIAAGSICFNAKLDIDEPPTPTLTAAGGETVARVGLSGLGTTDDVLGYRLCRGGTCGGDGGTGTSLTEADCSDDVTLESSPSTVNVDVSGLPLDTGVPVAVILVDRAHNESGISNTVCASHVNVGGFWERFCSERGFTDDAAGLAACRAQYQSCSCRTVGHGGRTGMGLFLLAAAALGVVVRRKR